MIARLLLQLWAGPEEAEMLHKSPGFCWAGRLLTQRFARRMELAQTTVAGEPLDIYLGQTWASLCAYDAFLSTIARRSFFVKNYEKKDSLYRTFLNFQYGTDQR